MVWYEGNGTWFISITSVSDGNDIPTVSKHTGWSGSHCGSGSSASYVDNYLFDNGYPRTTGFITLNTTYAIDTTVSNPSSSGDTLG